MKRILIATDGSACAEAAVDAGLALACETGAAVVAVAVGSALPIWGDSYYARAVSEEWSKLRLALDHVVERARELGVEATGELCEGQPVDGILALADERHVDLVVVGSRGLGAVRATILGSVSHGVVRGAKAPVLVVREPEPARRALTLVRREDGVAERARATTR